MGWGWLIKKEDYYMDTKRLFKNNEVFQILFNKLKVAERLPVKKYNKKAQKLSFSKMI